MNKDSSIMAAINLHAILKNIETLCELDEESQEIIKDSELSVRFIIPHILPLKLHFDKGSCKAFSGENLKADMTLRFRSPEHFNGMIEGTKNPIPTKGFLHVSFLKKEFTALAERLTKFLRPEPELLKNSDAFRKTSTILTAHVACDALTVLANLDPIGKACASRMKNGKVLFELDDSPIQLIVCDGKMHTKSGMPEEYDAYMKFEDIKTAGGILSGSADSYAAIGDGKLEIGGHIPLVDEINKILMLVPGYLS